MNDSRHGRHVPTGRDIARVLRGFNARLADDVVSRIERGRRIDLSAWAAEITRVITPFLVGYYLRGAEEARRRIAAAAKEKVARGLITKADGPVDEYTRWLMSSFDLLLPNVRFAINNMAFSFAQSTLATAETDAATAYDQFRESLLAGVSRGDALKTITAEVQRTFRDPIRAQRVAMTETSRAMHQGQSDAAKASGIVSGTKWLASSDACPKCLALDGKVVAFGEPFWVNPKGGPYAIVEHPPLHPHCMCAIEEVII